MSGERANTSEEGGKGVVVSVFLRVGVAISVVVVVIFVV
jgi:hypothetical protein